MGKGDRKTKKGKIRAGSFGVRRPARAKKTEIAVVPKAKTKKSKS